jgi:hypothetical protein
VSRGLRTKIECPPPGSDVSAAWAGFWMILSWTANSEKQHDVLTPPLKHLSSESTVDCEVEGMLVQALQ